MISTQIAKKIGLTRSAVSQMVNRLEERGIVKRVPDDVDRKIAYIELSEYAQEKYENERNTYAQFVSSLIQEFGKEKLDKLLELFDNFVETAATIKKDVK
ncbi:MAG: MarR family transcriptional regulator [Clostridia bacterium]|nr:MarR family transcriptional regulator [Clostridia bacterium]